MHDNIVLLKFPTKELGGLLFVICLVKLELLLEDNDTKPLCSKVVMGHLYILLQCWKVVCSKNIVLAKEGRKKWWWHGPEGFDGYWLVIDCTKYLQAKTLEKGMVAIH